MSIIENFAVLSKEEQREFATKLLDTINTESMFTADTKFEITNVEPDELSGGLLIEVSHANPIIVSRDATWSCADEDEAAGDPGYDADYANTIYEDTKKAFKTLSTVIDGYSVSLEISDVDETNTVSVEVDSTSNEDDGIGDYEYFGFTGNDSRPYVEVTGAIIKECECALAFFVEPADTLPIED